MKARNKGDQPLHGMKLGPRRKQPRGEGGLFTFAIAAGVL